MVNNNARRKKRARGRNARTQNQVNNTRAPVAVARMATTQPTATLRTSGVERLEEAVFATGTKSGTIILQKIISGHSGKRLGGYSALFQRVKFSSLRFEIRSQCSSLTGGGYTAAFIRDSDAVFSSGDAVLEQLTSCQGSKTASLWQTTMITVPSLPDSYYTDMPIDGSKRQASPGQLVIAVDGQATAPGSLVILLHWTAVFSDPAVEGDGGSPLPPDSLRVISSLAMWDCQWGENPHVVSTQVCCLVYPTQESTGTSLKLSGDGSLPDFNPQPNTLWRTRPFALHIEDVPKGSGTVSGVFMCDHMLCVDSPDGCFRPCVKFVDKLYDATGAFGTLGTPATQPTILGSGEVFKEGDVWTEVDVYDEPVNSSKMSAHAVQALRTAGRLWNPAWTVHHDEDRLNHLVKLHGNGKVVRTPHVHKSVHDHPGKRLPPIVGTVRSKRDVDSSMVQLEPGEAEPAALQSSREGRYFGLYRSGETRDAAE